MSREKLAPKAGTAQCLVLGTTLPVPQCRAALIHTRGTGTVCAVRRYERQQSVRPCAIHVLSGVGR